MTSKRDMQRPKLATEARFILLKKGMKTPLSTEEEAEHWEGIRRSLLNNEKLYVILSVEDLFRKCSVNTNPNPLGVVDIVGEKSGAFVVAWNIDFAEQDLGDIQSMVIKTRFVPTTEYPCFMFMFGVDDGHKDDTGKPAPIFGDYGIPISTVLGRVTLYQLITASEVIVYLFDGSPERFKTARLSHNLQNRKSILGEVKACFSSLHDYDFTQDQGAFQKSLDRASEAFISDGTPTGHDSFELFERRKRYSPPPNKAFWQEIYDASDRSK